MNLITPSSGLIYWQLGTLVVLLGYLMFQVYALIDLLRTEFREAHMKLIWALIIIFVPVIGTFMYLAQSRRSKADFRKFKPDFKTNNSLKD